MRVREGHRHDAGAIAEIHVASFRATYAARFSEAALASLDVEARAQQWTARLAEGRVLVAEQDGHPIGFSWFGASPDRDATDATWQLRSIHVAPDRVGTGAGRALLAATCRAMRAAGAGEATLWVVVGNARAETVYHRDGWRPDGARRRERLALPGEDGPEVEVRRLRRGLGADASVDSA